jgi:hypothetical protein
MGLDGLPLSTTFVAAEIITVVRHLHSRSENRGGSALSPATGVPASMSGGIWEDNQTCGTLTVSATSRATCRSSHWVIDRSQRSNRSSSSSRECILAGGN